MNREIVKLFYMNVHKTSRLVSRISQPGSDRARQVALTPVNSRKSSLRERANPYLIKGI